jgi:hypothetical protein
MPVVPDLSFQKRAVTKAVPSNQLEVLMRGLPKTIRPRSDRVDVRLARLPSLLPHINADFLCGTYECSSHSVHGHGAAETIQTGFPCSSELAAPILRPMVREKLRGFVDGRHIQHLTRMQRFDCHVWKSKIAHTQETRNAHRCSETASQ